MLLILSQSSPWDTLSLGGGEEESEIVTVMKTYLSNIKSKYSITVKENATKNKEIICNI